MKEPRKVEERREERRAFRMALRFGFLRARRRLRGRYVENAQAKDLNHRDKAWYSHDFPEPICINSHG